MKRTAKQPESDFIVIAGVMVRRSAVLWACIEDGRSGYGELKIQLSGAPKPLEIPFRCADTRHMAIVAMNYLGGFVSEKVGYETENRK